MKYFSGLIYLLVSTWCWQAQSSTASSMTPSLNKQLEINAERYGVVGQSVLILKNHHQIYRGVHGYANKELGVKVHEGHIFPSYSITKLFTSVLMMQLVEKGEVELNDSVRSYLPYLPATWQKATIAHLLSHTSGVPRYFDAVLEKGSFLPDKRAVYLSLAKEPVHFKTGTQNRYNNTNFLLLVSILELKTKKTYTQLVDEIFIKALGLKNTGHSSARAVQKNMVSSYQGVNGDIIKNLDIDWPDYSFAHSALYSTPEDLAAFMTALFKGKFVRFETLMALLNPMPLSNGNPGTYAFGFEFSFEDGFIRVGHDGGNRVKLRHYYNAKDSSDNFTLVYMTNGNTFDVWTDVLADSVMSIIEPDLFKLAKLKEQFVAAALAKDTPAMNEVNESVKTVYEGDMAAVEKFFLYRAYSLRYSSGAASSIGAFKFLVEKFPESENALQSLKGAQKALINKIETGI